MASAQVVPEIIDFEINFSVIVKMRYQQGSHRDWKAWKMKMVMEKSWNMKNWPKIIEFCDSVMYFCQFCPQIVLNLYFFGHR